MYLIERMEGERIEKLVEYIYYYSLITLDKWQNSKFHSRTIFSPPFSPNLGAWLLVGPGGKLHPLPFLSSLISTTPKMGKLSFSINIFYYVC